MLYMDSDVSGASCTEIVQWHIAASRTREIRFDTMIKVFVGPGDIFAKDSRIYMLHQLSSLLYAMNTHKKAG
jgi:hypothetical protein